jgi:hypothetical protein
MRAIASRILPLAIGMLLAGAQAGVAAAERSIEEIQACAHKNLPERSARQEVSFVIRDATGAEESIEAELFWKRGPDGRSRVLIRVGAPPDLRGAAFLLIEREGDSDLFTYLPALQKVRRISGRAISGSLFGSDFSYEDVERLQSLALETKVERQPDVEVAGRNTHVLSALLPPDPASTYTRVVSYVDAQTCVALRTELLNKDGMVNKELIIEADDVKPEGTRFVPREVLARDRDKGSETRLRIEKIEYDVPLSEKFFSEAALAKGH